jgi:hypothetical protein
MRLLTLNEDDELSLTKDLRENIPDYAIPSSTWGEDEDEVSFRDVMEGSGKRKSGYNKLRFCKTQVKRDGLRHFWVDTCCTYVDPPQGSCRRFWRQMPPEAAVFLATFPFGIGESFSVHVTCDLRDLSQRNPYSVYKRRGAP